MAEISTLQADRQLAGPADTHRYAGDLRDRLHLLHVADGDLWDPESAADVSPLGAGTGALHGAALVGTELAGRFDAECAGATEPGAAGDGGDPVTRLRQDNSHPFHCLALSIPGGHRCCIYRRRPSH